MSDDGALPESVQNFIITVLTFLRIALIKTWSLSLFLLHWMIVIGVGFAFGISLSSLLRFGVQAGLRVALVKQGLCLEGTEARKKGLTEESKAASGGTLLQSSKELIIHNMAATFAFAVRMFNDNVAGPLEEMGQKG
jgi:hypothetical protein